MNPGSKTHSVYPSKTRRCVPAMRATRKALVMFCSKNKKKPQEDEESQNDGNWIWGSLPKYHKVTQLTQHNSVFFYHWAKMTPQLRFMRITILQPDYTYIYLYVNGRTCIVFQVCAYTMYVRYLSIMSSRWACSGATSLVWSFPFGCPVRNCCGDRNSCRVTNTIHAIVHTVYIYTHTVFIYI